MILPKAPGLAGCTVISYYRRLLQKVSAYEGKTSRLPEATLLLIHDHSPTNSSINATLSASGLLSPSLQRSKYQDCTLTPTPPWQQSLGIITSSAEQEDGCSTQDSGDENSRQTDSSITSHPAQRGCLEDHNIIQERSPLLSAEHSFCGNPSIVKNPNSSVKKAVGNGPILNTFSPSQPECERYSASVTELCPRQLNRTLLSSSLAWDDLPFSESLAAFLCEENRDFFSETESNQAVQKETPRKTLETSNSATDSTSACQRNTHMTHSYSQIFLDITNTHGSDGADRHDLSKQASKNPLERINRSEERNLCSHEYDQQDEEDSSQCYDKDEEQLQGDAYNCSADLFSSSPMISTNTEMLNTNGESVRTTTEASPLFTKLDQQHQHDENVNVACSTPAKHNLKRSKCTNRDSLIPQITQDLEFIPPSQSTPIVKVGAMSKSPAYLDRQLTGNFRSQFDNQDSGAFSVNLHQLDSKKQAKTLTSVVCKLNTLKANKLFQCDRQSAKEDSMRSRTSSRCSYRPTPERRLWKPNKQNHLQAEQLMRVQKEDLNLESAGTVNHQLNSRVYRGTVCNDDDSEVIVPPTPAGRTQFSATPRRKRQTDTSSSSLGSAWDEQQGVKCKRTLLDQTCASSHRGKTVLKGSLDGSNDFLLDSENQTCDWSRDLFSDSV
ncbi:uncharacterized protein ddias isoform X2 [Acanthochromis polyacanthus]|nr:uncharacterized protein ddias isoform X2 [Acanthochromis polyacanthus]